MQKRNMAVTLECFVEKEGRFLMLHRSKEKRIMPDIWMAPGGHREFNEGLFACAKREIKEETGLNICNLKVKATGNAYLKSIEEEFYFHFLTADYESGILTENCKDGTLQWFKPSEILQLENLLPELKHVLPHVFEDKPNIISFKAEYDAQNALSFIEIEKP